MTQNSLARIPARIGVAVVGMSVLVASSLSRGAPLSTAFTYQGRLKSAGSPASGLHDLRFRLYDASPGGGQLGTTLCLNDVNVTGGLFTVTLDFGPQFNGEERFLEIDVRADTGLDCSNTSGFTTLVPRQPLNGTPYAQYALDADRLDGFGSESFLFNQVPLIITGASTTSAVEVTNTSSVIGTFAVRGTSQAAGGAGVVGSVGEDLSISLPAGVAGSNTLISGSGVVGRATSSSGTTSGGAFTSLSNSGTGVRGTATSSTGQTYGGHFTSSSSQGSAVYGEAKSMTGTTYGGAFLNSSTDGFGVYAAAVSTSSTAYGGFFRSFSTTGKAGGFYNSGLGSAFEVDLAGPNGAINTAGFLHREYTVSTPSVAIPIAYGSISTTATINGGTGNFTVSHPAAGQYDITVNGETYSNNTFTVTITPVTNSPRITGVADPGAAFRVNIWNISGTLVDTAFHFTIWTANPSQAG